MTVLRFLTSRDFLTSAVEVAGAGLLVGGAFVLFGLGVALCVAGVALLALGYLASGGAE